MKKLLPFLFLLSAPVFADTFYCADEDFTPAGNDGNSGADAANPRTDGWCRTAANADPGDIFIYASGNYEGEDFVITDMDGTSVAFITHRCAGQYTCSFDRIGIEGSSFLEMINFRGDSNAFDSTKSETNPRVRVYDSNDITLTANYFRGTPGDQATTYSDVVVLGKNSDNDANAAWNIVIRSSDTYGAAQILHSPHQLLKLHGVSDGTACTTKETGYAVIGTPDTPFIFYNEYHHNLNAKGVCKTLVQHVDFQRAGTGRGDLVIPNYLADGQQGGQFHGADYRYFVGRFNTMSYAGSGTDDNKNQAGIEVGLFGDTKPLGLNTASEACFAHNSSWRHWGSDAIVGQLNQITSVDDVVFLNNAADEIGYLETTESGSADRAANGYYLHRTGGTTVSDVYVDGIVFDPVTDVEGDKFVYKELGVDTPYASTDCGTTQLGDSDIECGNSITYQDEQFFKDPANRDFTINSGDPAGLAGNAVYIANITSASDTGTTASITTNRAQCFMGPIGESGYGWPGDTITIGGDEVTITAVDYDNDTITWTPSITYANGEGIWFVVDSIQVDDHGAIPDGTVSPGPGPVTPGPGLDIPGAFYDVF